MQVKKKKRQSAGSERGLDYQDVRKEVERCGEDLVRRDEKRMRRGADSRIKKERMGGKKSDNRVEVRQRPTDPPWLGARAERFEHEEKGMKIISR